MCMSKITSDRDLHSLTVRMLHIHQHPASPLPFDLPYGLEQRFELVVIKVVRPLRNIPFDRFGADVGSQIAE